MKKTVLALLCTVCLYAPVFSQSSQPAKSLDEVVGRLQTLSADKAIEKAYLHFDRPYYSAGDTMYFKAYVTLGEQRELSKLSGLLHVDLINPEDSLLKTISLQLVNGLAPGDFSLPATLPAGNYRVRAYTRWMLNNGQTNFFNQHVFVNNPSMAGMKKPSNSSTVPKIQFFPEAGNLVNGVPAKLAFKAVGSDGLGVDVKGVITDNTDAELTKLQSTHLGMGVLFITPEAGKTYKAKLTYADGTKATVNLPVADNEGMTLQVNNNDPDKLTVEINANKAYYLKNKNKEIAVVIYSAGSVRTVKTVLDNQVLDLNLNKKEFKTGIVQITLFSAQGEPLNERLAFIQNPDLLNITALSDKPFYSARGKVHFSINTKNKEGMPVSSFLSAAVIDIGNTPITENAETSILSNLLLTSDLRGMVEQPNYYFTNVNADTRSNLDVLMLTQGYRRFEWKRLLNEPNTAATYKPERSFDISGQVKTLKGAPVDGGAVTLMPQAGGTLLTQTTDHNGNFTFTNLVYDDKTRFMLEAKTVEEKSNTHIAIAEAKQLAPIEKSTLQSSSSPINTIETQPVYLADISRKVSIATAGKQVVNGDRINNVVDKNTLQDQTTLSTGLQGRLNGVVIRQGIPYLADKVNAVMQGGPMLIVMDDTVLPQGTSIDNYSATDIERVEVLKSADASIYGVRGANGVLILKTRKGATPVVVNNVLSPGLLVFTVDGFYKARTFYSPVYESPKSINNKPDNRTTIYWNPDIVTANDGTTSIDFFNADSKGTYRMVIEGTDGNGNLGRSVLTYKVQ